MRNLLKNLTSTEIVIFIMSLKSVKLYGINVLMRNESIVNVEKVHIMETFHFPAILSITGLPEFYLNTILIFWISGFPYLPVCKDFLMLWPGHELLPCIGNSWLTSPQREHRWTAPYIPLYLNSVLQKTRCLKWLWWVLWLDGGKMKLIFCLSVSIWFSQEKIVYFCLILSE